ncbi:glucose-6-phosphate dehydrogenase assembly protein OpcA [bacterium]|nr:glucose-6-phosphate dehydrogenase assembly protein OpcA [bacterium]
MSTDSQLESFTAGEETAVDVARIERQLHELWQLAAESEKDPSRRAITRASLLNFVAYTETEAERDAVTTTISELTSRHPCRAMVLQALPDDPQPGLSASITAHCHLAGGGQKQVCCEQISVTAHGPSVVHLAAAVLPLLEADLPTVVWWPGLFLARSDTFCRLLAVADRFLYHSSSWPDAEQYLPELATTVGACRPGLCGDLSWTRLSIWRKLIAEAFDEPGGAAALARLRSVEIVHGQGPGVRLRALLLAGWLATRLGWDVLTARQRVRLVGREDEDTVPTGIISVDLRSDAVAVTVRKHFGERAASATVTMPNVCGLPRKLAFWADDHASLLSVELDGSTPPGLYQPALALAAELATAG